MDFLMLRLPVSLQLIAMMLQVKVALTQTCLQSNGSVPFVDMGDQADILPTGSQVIVTSYQFQCCGRVTRWQTYIAPEGLAFYSIRFQVWRPGPAVESDGCYSLVGEDVYDNLLDSRLVNRLVDSSTVISVQPGDVVGYYVITGNGARVFEGIQLEQRQDGLMEETVWYYVFSEQLPLSPSGTCPFAVGLEKGNLLSFTNAAPVFSIDIASTACTVMQSTTAPRLVPASTSTPTPQASESPPGDQASGLSVRDIALTVGGSVLAALVLLIGTISVAVLVHRKKKGSQKLKENTAYVATPNVTTSTNESYATSTTMADNQAYSATNITSTNESYATSATMADNQAYGLTQHLDSSMHIMTTSNESYATSVNMAANQAYGGLSATTQDHTHPVGPYATIQTESQTFQQPSNEVYEYIT